MQKCVKINEHVENEIACVIVKSVPLKVTLQIFLLYI